MAVNEEFVMKVPGRLLFDRNLSLKAKGLMVVILSLPDKRKLSEDYIQRVLGHDGQTAVRSAIKELETNGYICRTRVRNDTGRVVRVKWEILI